MVGSVSDMKQLSVVVARVVPDFDSGKSRIQPFFGNPTKSGSGEISSQICQI